MNAPREPGWPRLLGTLVWGLAATAAAAILIWINARRIERVEIVMSDEELDTPDEAPALEALAEKPRRYSREVERWPFL